MRSHTALIGVALALLLAPAAGAEVRTLPLGGDPDTTRGAAPTLLPGGGVAWVAALGGQARVMLADPGSEPRVLATLPDSQAPSDVVHAEQYTVQLGDGIVVATRYAETCSRWGGCRSNSYETKIRETFAGAPGTVLERVSGCGFAPGEPRCDADGPPSCSPALRLVAADVLARSQRCPYGTVPPPTTLQRVSEPAPYAELAADEVVVDAAGPWLLTATGPFYGAREHVLRDLTSGAEQRRLHPLLSNAHVQADGTVVATAGDRVIEAPGEVVAFRLGAEPQPLGVRSTPQAVGADRVLLGRAGEAQRIVSLDGGPPLDLQTPSLVVEGEVAFDGERVAYVVRRCQAGIVVVRRPEDPAPALDAPCATATVTGSVRVTPDAAFVTLRCAPDPRVGCSGSVRVVLRARRLGPGSVGQYALPLIWPADVPPGESRTFRVGLSERAMRFLRRTPPASAVVTSHYVPDENPGRPPAAEPVVRRRVPVALGP